MRIRSFIGASVLAATLSASAVAQATVTLLDYKTTVPAGWTSRTPSSNMRLAEYTISGKDSASTAEVVVYFFGPGQGGNVEANLARWKSQFSNPDGSPVREVVSRSKAGDLSLTFAEYRGSYARAVGMGDPARAKPGQMLIAGIAETPRGTIFFQLFGPEASVAAQRQAFMKFVGGLR